MSIFSIFTNKPSGVFAGKVVAFTGTLQSGNRKMQRSEAQQIVKSLGGDVVVGEYGKIRNANMLVGSCVPCWWCYTLKKMLFTQIAAISIMLAWHTIPSMAVGRAIFGRFGLRNQCAG